MLLPPRPPPPHPAPWDTSQSSVPLPAAPRLRALALCTAPPQSKRSTPPARCSPAVFGGVFLGGVCAEKLFLPLPERASTVQALTASPPLRLGWDPLPQPRHPPSPAPGPPQERREAAGRCAGSRLHLLGTAGLPVAVEQLLLWKEQKLPPQKRRRDSWEGSRHGRVVYPSRDPPYRLLFPHRCSRTDGFLGTQLRQMESLLSGRRGFRSTRCSRWGSACDF